MMVKPFEEAAYKLKEGEISGLVQSDYGFHIIKLTGIKPGSVKPLDEVKSEIVADIRKQLSTKKYSQMAETFTDTVYEQADSLKPVADKLGLKIETAANVTRQPNPALGQNAPFNQQKFLTALFSDDVVKNKRNTEAVEVAPNTLVAGRIVSHKPASKRPFEEVKAGIRERVVQEEAVKLARQAGEAKVAALKAKDDASGFGPAKVVSRSKHEDMDAAALSAVMKADVSRLPAYAGTELPQQGYAVYRILKVMQPATADAARRQAEAQQISGIVAQQETAAYVEALKQKAKVKLLKPVEQPKSEAAQ
jgi:peptidyl-prolyl cis-trans isomerase D